MANLQHVWGYTLINLSSAAVILALESSGGSRGVLGRVLSNPAMVNRLLVGVFARQWVAPLAHVLANLGAQRAWVVHCDGDGVASPDMMVSNATSAWASVNVVPSATMASTVLKLGKSYEVR